MRPTGMALVWVFVALLVLLAIAANFLYFQPKPAPVPEGWQIIRPPTDIQDLALQGDHLWVGGRDGVFRIERSTGKSEEMPFNPPLRYARDLCFDSAGVLWIAHEGGLARWDGRTARTFTVADGLPDEFVTALYLDRTGRLWVGTYQGIAFQEGDRWRRWEGTDRLIDPMVFAMTEDPSGRMWFGSLRAPRGGLTIWEPDADSSPGPPDPTGRWQHLDAAAGLPHNNVNGFIFPSETEAWAATGLHLRGGVAILNRNDEGWRVTRRIMKEDGLAGEKARSLFLDRDGRTWCGSEYDGVAVTAGGGWRIFTEREGLSQNEVRIMVQDKDGDLWLGTTNGVTRIRSEALARLPRPGRNSQH